MGVVPLVIGLVTPFLLCIAMRRQMVNVENDVIDSGRLGCNVDRGEVMLSF